jgi:hypothetical protein
VGVTASACAVPDGRGEAVDDAIPVVAYATGVDTPIVLVPGMFVEVKEGAQPAKSRDKRQAARRIRFMENTL